VHKFTDNAGRDWPVSLTVADVKRVRRVLDVDLANLMGEDVPEGKQLLARLTTDPVLLVDVLYVICEPQATRDGVSDIEFGRAMAGDAIEQATDALLEAIVGFTPNPRERARLARVKRELYQAREALDDLFDVRLEKVLDDLIPGRSSTNSPPVPR